MQISKPSKNFWYILAYAAVCAAFLIMGIRGMAGNPTPTVLNTSEWREDGPMELSPERGRFALLYSVVEDKSVFFSTELARFVTPDLGYANGKYVSLFAPGVSFLAMPGYLIGKLFNLAQVGAFATSAVFALLNLLLIRAIAIRLGVASIPASIGAAAVIFGTPAFVYAGTLYQHHISSFLILSSIYILLRWNNFWSLAAIWFLIACAIPVDYPNLVLMIPVGVVALARLIQPIKLAKGWSIQIRAVWLLSFVTVALPLAAFLYFNKISYGSPFQLSGTVPGVDYINELGLPDKSPDDFSIEDGSDDKKTAIGFFRTRNMLDGFYTHLVSFDRGIIFYAPIILFGVIGFILYRKLYPETMHALIGIVLLNLLLYSMWGDPHGGWAFGSRYLIPTYLIMGIGVALFLQHFQRNRIILAAFVAIMAFSVWVSVLGAVSFSLNPPQHEILSLEQKTGRVEKYTFMRNYDYVQSGHSKSFVFRSFAGNFLTASQYHLLLTGLIVALLGSATGYYAINSKGKHHA